MLLNVENINMETREIFLADYIQAGFNQKSIKKTMKTLVDHKMIIKVRSETGRFGWRVYRLLNPKLIEEICENEPKTKRQWKKLKKTIFSK